MSEHLEHVTEPELRDLLKSLTDECAKIGKDLSDSIIASTGTKNSFGDAQLNADMTADGKLWALAEASPQVCAAASEESPKLRVRELCIEKNILTLPRNSVLAENTFSVGIRWMARVSWTATLQSEV